MLTTNQILQKGRYRIVNKIGQDETGVIYEGFDNNLNAKISLKEIRGNAGKVLTAAQLESQQKNFSQKAKPLTEMKHQSLINVQDFFSEIDRHYLVAEFIEGSSLGDLIEKKKSPFSLTDVSHWAENLLDALNYLHTLNPQIIHSELKPQNIKLAPDGKVKLSAYNLVKDSGEKTKSAVSGETFDAAALPYLPLEQIWGGLDSASRKVILTNYDEKSEKILEQPADPRSDIYSLAATLYHLLTARMPADALTRSIDILEGKSDPLQSPNTINPTVPAEVSEVLMKAMEIKRENRFSSAMIMRQVLRTAFVRVREREAATAKHAKFEDDAVLEIPAVTKQKPVLPQTLPQKNPEIETGQLRQLELIKKQLREAEARRLEAEKRAAEAEKRLLEAEKHISVEPLEKAPAVEHLPAQVQAEAPVKSSEEYLIDDTPPVPSREVVKKEHESDNLSSLFVEPQKESNSFKKAAAGLVVLAVLGAGGFGFWKFSRDKSADSVQTVTTSNGSTVVAEPTAQPTPAVNTEKTPEPNYQATTEKSVAPNAPLQNEETTSPSSNPSQVKSKPATTTQAQAQTAQAKKPTPATPAKSDEKPKKVTLDDLLKDN